MDECYLYDGQNEIGAFTNPINPKNLRVLGIAKHKNYPETVGIELDGQISAPLLDVQSNVRRLVDLKKRTPTGVYDFTAFGEELQNSTKDFNPWRFASKRYDPELSLIYFGQRYYDPCMGRWLTVDPAGFVDSVNLYQYVFNNPFRYIDPDGQFVFAIPLFVWGAKLTITASYAIYGAITGVLAYGAYKGVQALNARDVNDTYSPAQDYAEYSSRFEASVEEEENRKYDKRHTPDQEAISELVKESGRKGVSNEEADTLLDWAKEYDFPARDDRGKRNEQGRPHWEGGEHIHLGPKHVKVNN